MIKINQHQYDDIVRLTRPVSTSRKRMTMVDRAAQFSPFAALVGYEDTLEETARLTGRRIALDENEKYFLDLRQQHLLRLLPQKPMITVTYFQPDKKKDGGSYVTVSGRLKSIFLHARMLLLYDGTEISLDEIIDLDSPLLSSDI